MGDVPAEKPIGAQQPSVLRHPSNRNTKAERQLIAGLLKARLSFPSRFQDDLRGIQKGSQISLNRVVFAIDPEQPSGLGDEEAFFRVGRGIQEKTSFEPEEIEKDVPWAYSLVRALSGQPVEIGRPGPRIDYPVVRPIGHALPEK